jgi:hypothetical protein
LGPPRSPLFGAREGGIHERLIQVELATLMQMSGQQTKRFDQPALANPLLKASVAGLVRRILGGQLRPVCPGAQNTPCSTARVSCHGRPRLSSRHPGMQVAGDEELPLPAILPPHSWW